MARHCRSIVAGAIRCLTLLLLAGALPENALAQAARATSAPHLARHPTFTRADSIAKVDILLVVAHQDDETAITPYLARATQDEGRKVAVVYLAGNQGTRSRGVALTQNRAALDHFGITQSWVFETAGEDYNVLLSLARMDHGRLLERLVSIIRFTRPEVVLTWIPAALRDHSVHQASGVIATEAFDLAGDPSAFPAELRWAGAGFPVGGLHPWQPKRLYYFTEPKGLDLALRGPAYPTGDISPTRGISYEALAAHSAAEYRSLPGFSELAEALDRGEPLAQALKPYQEIGGREMFPDPTRFILARSHVPGDAARDLFAGLVPGEIAFQPAPQRRTATGDGVHLRLGEAWSYYEAFWATHGIEHLSRLHGPIARQDDDEVDLTIPLLVVNTTSEPRTIEVAGRAPPGWEIARGPGSYDVPANTIFPVYAVMRPRSAEAATWGDAVWEAVMNGSVTSSISVRIQAATRG